ncbi:glycosyltransferase family 2 protein [Clostridium sp. JS66]|uniref:glycosyltransferase family 2 protein n=1 Tax=Clostridium sp. JS66 TaxID=3064705 RepID=UPI00298E5811|nr:glycosyltransferase family 2 protein [Clostridium sp. JS66]WPC43283.1 glycosyltransferase family 2 protein [Clostridium sp. JS66]
MKVFLYVTLAISIFAPIYTYVVYPVLLKVVGIFFQKKYKIDKNYRPFVSILVAAYNEEKVIKEKIINLSKLEYPDDKIEFIIGSDGSSDKTVDIAKSYSHIKNLRILDLPRGGKVNALNSMLKIAKGEVLVFSDANTIYDSKAVKELVKYFTDKTIGCVSGQLRYKLDESSGNGAKSEGLYWKYENCIKALESKLGKLSGANGAIYAVRKDLIKEIRKGIINDDFYIATNALQLGYDVILETKAVAYEEPNDEFLSQFKRHVRDGAGHYQSIGIFWRMLLPRKGSLVHISHRVIRWIIPFCFISTFITNALLLTQSLFMEILFVCQIIGYLTLGFYYEFIINKNRNINNSFEKFFRFIFYFMAINFALLLGCIRFLRKQQKAIWETQR